MNHYKNSAGKVFGIEDDQADLIQDDWVLMTSEEFKEHCYPAKTIDDLSTDARHLRDQLLSSADVEINKLFDAGLSTSLWSTYRQALRDIPQQDGFPEIINWPEVPTAG